jgi:hypothetical protein
MKSKMIILAFVVVLGMTLYPLVGYAQMEHGKMGRSGGGGQGYTPQQEGGWNFCPYCGSPLGPGGGYGMGPGMMGPGMMGRGYGMGPGMMGPGMMGRGYGMGYGMMGPGMMGRGYGMGPGMMGPGMMGRGWGMGPQYGPQYQQQQKPMEEKDAREILENYLRSTRNPNLKLGKVIEKGNYFEAEILTKDNSLVDKIIVDKYSGWMRSIY